MTQQQRPPEPYGDDWKTWGRRLMQFMSQTRSPLVQVELYSKRRVNMYYHFPHKYHRQAQAQYTFTFGLA